MRLAVDVPRVVLGRPAELEECLLEVAAFARVDDGAVVVEAGAERLLFAVAEDPGRRLVPEADAALRIGIDDGFRAAERQPLGWQGVVRGESVRFVDEWRRVATEIVAPGAAEFWIAPIETVSESEDGFERVYQGSQILAVWPLALEAGKDPWEAQVELQVTSL